MAETVYALCALTSLACAMLLFRGFRASRARLLLWSTVCFVGLAVNNVLLFVDMVVTGPSIDLSLVRTLPAIAGVAALVWGLVWDAE